MPHLRALFVGEDENIVVIVRIRGMKPDDRARRQPLFVDDLIQQICDMAGVPAPRLKAPLMMTLAGAYWAETAAAMVGRKSAWPSLPMLLTGAGHAVEISPAQQALGVAPRALSQTLADALAWYRQIGRC